MTANQDEKKPAGAVKSDVDHKIEELQMGVWTVKFAVQTTLGFSSSHWNDWKSVFPLLLRLTVDIYGVAPGYFTVFMLCQIWKGIEDALLMSFSSRLLKAVEAGISEGKFDSKEILSAIFYRLLCSMLVAYFDWHGRRVLNTLRSRVTRHFDLFLMEANLRVDLPTSQAVGSKQEVGASQVWHAFEQIFLFLTQLLRAGCLLAFLAHLSRSTGGPFFSLLTIAEPLFITFFDQGLWNKICFGFSNNEHYQRMQSLQKFANGDYRQDIISGGLADWISTQFRQSHEKLGETSDNHPFMQSGERESPYFDIFHKLLADLPMVYCALTALIFPKQFSIVTFAVIQHSSMTLRNSLRATLHRIQQFRKSLASLEALYASPTVVNILKTGSVAYPREDESPYSGATRGMSFQLRNISFSYPGSQSTVPALKDISLSIDPGQLIVIVGSNGSGKSTLVRILARLYDPNSGEIEIDGLSSKDYCIDDLHQATTILSQDSMIYPLSLAENIGLGYPDHASDTTMIEEAARLGGAFDFIQKLKDGMNTILDPFINTFQVNLFANRTHPLFQEMEKIRKKVDISGGERQRVIAARSFMRFKSGKVKFVAVDEPSSALDAEAEWKLFERLINVRMGKTMIFVTHRFGHLTKHADQIICMKEGSVAEMGNHEELMRNKGEYANLYEIQASAFSH